MSIMSLSYWLARLRLTTRLYAIIALLGMLPIAGVILATNAVHSTWRDHGALDRAARGSIHLERINGLVYAIVMESRGIYMSESWTVAEPYAKRLTTGLGQLEREVSAWKAIAIESQHSNAIELSKRINQFIEFRTELVRLAAEKSTAEARIFRDNDENRSVRAVLNMSLQDLARAYEVEIKHWQVMIAANDRNILTALSVLAGLAGLVLVGGIALVRGSLLTPLLDMKRSMLHLADGNLDKQVTGLDRTDEIGEMAKSLAVFHATSLERTKLNREAQLLAQLNEWLQSCKSLDELYQMVADFLAKLLPDCAGSLYVYSNSRDILESAKVWNGGTAPHGMHPDDCWGLRRGRTYTFGEQEIDFPCAHVGATHTAGYCCIPILAHGETIGLLQLTFKDGHAAAGQPRFSDEITEQRRLGAVCAEQISMAIANVKLREQLRDQSIRDVLTGLFNRRYMLETLRRELARAARAKQCVGILSIDIDHFKKFNDNHGHDAGDTVLRAFGGCLEKHFREEDVPCRFGGEEFVVLLPGATAEDAARRADSLRVEVEALALRYLDGTLPRITISIGVAEFPRSGDSPETVLKAADEALDRAKDNGRNRVEIYTRSAGLHTSTNAVHELQRASEIALVEGRARASADGRN